MHHLARDELGDGEPDDVRGAVDIGDDVPSRSSRPASDIVTGTVAVGPSCGQDCFEDGRAHGVAAAGDVEREFRSELSDAGCAAALPLGPE